jgi:hypothetical protein
MNAAEAQLERALVTVDAVLNRSSNVLVPPAEVQGMLPELMLSTAGIRRVVRVPGPGRWLRAMTTTLSPRQLRKAVWAPASTRGAGIFLTDATRDEAYSWARRWARSQFQPGTHVAIVPDDPHIVAGRLGLPHFHIEVGPRRSAHIFYGRVPAADFFAAT